MEPASLPPGARRARRTRSDLWKPRENVNFWKHLKRMVKTLNVGWFYSMVICHSHGKRMKIAHVRPMKNDVDVSWLLTLSYQRLIIHEFVVIFQSPH
jgi:hypothetical protein